MEGWTCSDRLAGPHRPDDAVTLDDVCERLIIHGAPGRAADEIMTFRAEVGPFGTMRYAGHDWREPTLARRSMTLMAEQVLPLVKRQGRRHARRPCQRQRRSMPRRRSSRR